MLRWHQAVDRYKEFELRGERLRSARPLLGPSGLGTSAARVASLFGAPRARH